MAQVTCRHCGKKIDKELAYKESEKSRSYYCDKEEFEIHTTKNKKSTSKFKPEEGTDRRILTDYIQDLYIDEGYDKHRIPWVMIMSQVKNMISDYNFKYTGIKMTLEYMIDEQGMKLFPKDSNGSILNLVPFYYDMAKYDFIDRKEYNKTIEDFNFESESVVIKKSIDKEKKSCYNEINLDEMIEGGKYD